MYTPAKAKAFRPCRFPEKKTPLSAMMTAPTGATGGVELLLGFLAQYVLATDVPLLRASCERLGYSSPADLIRGGPLTEKRLASLGVSTPIARRMLLRELKRLAPAERPGAASVRLLDCGDAASPSASEPDEPELPRPMAPSALPAEEPEPEPELQAVEVGPPYLALTVAAPSAASDWPVPRGAVRLPTLLQAAQQRLAFALHLLSRSSVGGGAALVRISSLERMDLDVVELVGQLAVGDAAPIERVLSAAGLHTPAKKAVVERHLGLVGLMGSAHRLEALTAMYFHREMRHGKHRGKWSALVTELLLDDGGDSGVTDAVMRMVAAPSVLAMTTALTASRHQNNAGAQLRRTLSDAEKQTRSLLEDAVRALPTGVALRHAATTGEAAEAARLLQSGADVDSTDDTGCSALWLAAFNNHAAAAESLIGAGADVELPNEAGMTALMAAACHGSCSAVSTLLNAGADWRRRDTEEGRTAMDWAKGSRRADATLVLQSWLLEHGSESETTAFLNEALRQAVTDGVLTTELEVKRLVASGAQVDGADVNGTTALYLAAACGELSSLEALITTGARLDVADNDGWTALMAAAETGSLAAIEHLLRKGANRWLANCHGRTAEDIATGSGQAEAAKLLRTFTGGIIYGNHLPGSPRSGSGSPTAAPSLRF